MQLFDALGPAARPPALQEAVRALAADGEAGRGAVYTRVEVVEFLLDLCGYDADRPLHRLVLLEPAFGEGDFLLPAVDRLLDAYFRHGGAPHRAARDLERAVVAVELHEASFRSTRERLVERLQSRGLDPAPARGLADAWLVHDDFLLADLPGRVDVAVGNPPYVRQERIPRELLAEYRRRYSTLYDRADLYVPFFERCLDLLAPGGRLGFICSNRWMKNRYGGPLREKIARSFELQVHVDMVQADAFHDEVLAYPAITVIRRPPDGSPPGPTRIARWPGPDRAAARRLADALRGEGQVGAPIRELPAVASGRDPWLLDAPEQLALIRRLERRFPPLEQAGCRVGIGVATGADRVFIGRFDELDVEPERKLPLVMAGDLHGPEIAWSGQAVVNPFEDDGSLADLRRYPRFARYLQAHAHLLKRRHVARRNPAGWYRTIDRIHPALTHTPKLLVPDIKGTATVALDPGRYYPHHNLYFITSSSWDLRALQAVLRSAVAVLFVSAYCVKMAGGFLRFQAQFLRRIRLPDAAGVPGSLMARLAELGPSNDRAAIDEAVGDLYGLSAAERATVVEVDRSDPVLAALA